MNDTERLVATHLRGAFKAGKWYASGKVYGVGYMVERDGRRYIVTVNKRSRGGEYLHSRHVVESVAQASARIVSQCRTFAGW